MNLNEYFASDCAGTNLKLSTMSGQPSGPGRVNSPAARIERGTVRTAVTAYLSPVKLLLIIILTLSPHLAPSALAQYSTRASKIVKIGILFEKATVNQTILDQSVNNINTNDKILTGKQLKALSKTFPELDPVGAVRTVCDWLDDEGITTLISSTSCATSVALQAIMSRVQIPHLRIPTQYCDFSAYPNLTSMTLSIDPSMENTNKALKDIIYSQQWDQKKSIIVFFDDSLDCQKSQSVKASLSGVATITFFHTSFNSTPGASNPATTRMFQALKSDTTSEYVFIALGSDSAVSGIFAQAIQMALVSGSITWVLSTPQGLNYTMLPARSTSATVTVLIPSVERSQYKEMPVVSTFNDAIALSQALDRDVYDAVQFVSFGIHLLDRNAQLPQKNNFTCWPDVRQNMRGGGPGGMGSIDVSVDSFQTGYYDSSQNQWSYGGQLYKNIKGTLDNGGFVQDFMTGTPNTVRAAAMFDIFTFNQSSARWNKTGKWAPDVGLRADSSAFSSYKGLKGQKLKIVTVEEIPFMMKTVHENGSVTYTGFCQELLATISKTLNFSYEIYDVSEYGKQVGGQWQGAIGEVVNKQADMAVSGMTIIAEREKYVDFTVRYMDYGVGIILSKPKPTSANTLGFLSPLSYEVWGCIMLAIIFEGGVLLCITKVSPYTKYTAADIEESDKEKFKVKNSFWFTMSSVLQQGPEDQPRTISGRVLAMFWYFFTLIMVATYTANLAAFLTITRLDTPIQSLENLVDQSIVDYGTVNDSSVYRAFQEQKGNNVLYERIAAYFDKTPTSPVKTPEDGYERVKNFKYAFMWDEPVLQYMAAMNCNFMTVGKPFLLKGYGIALQRGIPYREDVNSAILSLQESGELDKLKRKWFEPKSTCPGSDSSKGSSITGIQIQNVAGVFYVLVLGSILSVAAALGELIWYKLINRSRSARSSSMRDPSNECLMGKKELAAYNTEMNASYDGHHVPNPNNPNKWAPGLNFNMLNAANGSAYQQKPSGPQSNMMNSSSFTGGGGGGGGPVDNYYGYSSMPPSAVSQGYAPRPSAISHNPQVLNPGGPGSGGGGGYYGPPPAMTATSMNNTSSVTANAAAVAGGPGGTLRPSSRQSSKESGSYQREATV